MSKNIWSKVFKSEEWNGQVSGDHEKGYHQLIQISNEKMRYVIDYDDEELCVQLKSITIGHATWKMVNGWCEENFKDRYCLWNHEICCRNEEDAMAFKLRWM